MSDGRENYLPQVEHPVTEGITGVNLPSIQLQVAMGIPLNRIPDVRRFYGLDPDGDSKIDFMNDEYILPKKHVIAVSTTCPIRTICPSCTICTLYERRRRPAQGARHRSAYNMS
jgi:hypothetical protein